jgi:hypothetical protein
MRGLKTGPTARVIIRGHARSCRTYAAATTNSVATPGTGISGSRQPSANWPEQSDLEPENAGILPYPDIGQRNRALNIGCPRESSRPDPPSLE